MSFESIRPGLASRSTLGVALARLPPLYHHHRLPPIPHHPNLPNGRTRSVPPLFLRTRCSTSLPVSRPSGMRPRSTASSSVKMWRPSGPTCAQFWPTRLPSFVLSKPFRTSLPNFSLSTSSHYSDPVDHQGSFLTLSRSFIDIGDTVHLFGGVWVIRFWCICFSFGKYLCMLL